MNEAVAATPFENFCAVILKDSLKAKYANPWNPYEISLLFCMERLRARLFQLEQMGKRVPVIFESRGRPEDDALELEFRRVIANERQWGYRHADFSIFSWEPIFVAKQANSSGLQLADLVARPIGLRTLRPDQPNRAFDVIGPKIRARKVFP